MGGRETVLVTSERQLFVLVSKDRARHCLRDGAEEARSQRPVLVWVLRSARGFGLKQWPSPRESVGLVSLPYFVSQS